MPTCEPELSAKFEHDGEACDVLEALGWKEVGVGNLIAPAPGYKLSPGRETDALNYLIFEWDYSWIG